MNWFYHVAEPNDTYCQHHVPWETRCLSCDVDIGARIIHITLAELGHRPIDDLMNGSIYEGDDQ